MPVAIFIYPSIILYIVTGMLLYKLLNKKTKYEKDNHINPPDKIAARLILLWPVSIFSIKKIKRLRTIYYYEQHLQNLKYSTLLWGSIQKSNREIQKVQRKIKILKLK